MLTLVRPAGRGNRLGALGAPDLAAQYRPGLERAGQQGCGCPLGCAASRRASCAPGFVLVAAPAWPGTYPECRSGAVRGTSRRP
jgi:hypothetical protein